MTVVDDAHKIATKDLDLTKRFVRLQGAFARRRGELHHKIHGSWDATKLAAQLTADLAVVRSYASGKDSLVKGTETTTPAHLDLKDAARVKTDFDQKLVDARELEYRTLRREWIEQIVWRAVAIHPELWNDTGTALQTEALDEILDRRLRAVEQLHCNVNSGGVEVSPASRTWTVKAGDWEDGHRVRSVEYPFLPKGPFQSVLKDAPGWTDAGSMFFFPGIQVPHRIVAAWRNGNPWVVYQPGQMTHEDVFKQMFGPPRENFLQRSWLFCDMVGSAVNLEAVEFAVQRRPGHLGDLDAPMSQSHYVVLGPLIRQSGQDHRGYFMDDGADTFFENGAIPLDDLQVGDFVCFWNNRIYDLLEDGAWRNEFSHVMGIDANGFGANIRNLPILGLQITLAGHGLVTMPYNSMAQDLATRTLTLLKALRKQLTDALAAGASAPSPHQGRLVSWAPYESFDPPGPWWIEIPKTIWQDDWYFASQGDVLKGVPRTVARETGGSGYTPPPQADAVYFPLYEPAVAQTGDDGDSWRAYLRQRKADKAFRAPTQLRELPEDIRVAPGLFTQGATNTVFTVRPRVRI